MTRLTAIALLVVVPAIAGVSAQTSPTSAPSTAITVNGCVEPVQQDGSLAPKPGTFATPTTAPMDANSPPEPTGVFMLLDPQTIPPPLGAAPSRTTYALIGHDAEMAKLKGVRVEISGSIVPDVPSGKAQSVTNADSTQRLRVTSVKKIAGGCTAPRK